MRLASESPDPLARLGLKDRRVYQARLVNEVFKEIPVLLECREKREKRVREGCLAHGAFRVSLESQPRRSFLLQRPSLLRHLSRHQPAARSRLAGQRPTLLLHRRQQSDLRLRDL